MERQQPAANQALRGDVPAIAPPPDRARWEAEHGYEPWPLSDVSRTLRFLDKLRVARMIGRARACIRRDLATLDRIKAIRESVKLEHICERVKTAHHIEHAEVFFDPSDNQFWVYPHGAAETYWKNEPPPKFSGVFWPTPKK